MYAHPSGADEDSVTECGAHAAHLEVTEEHRGGAAVEQPSLPDSIKVSPVALALVGNVCRAARGAPDAARDA